MQDYYRGIDDTVNGYEAKQRAATSADYRDGLRQGARILEARGKATPFKDVPEQAVFYFVNEERFLYCKRSTDTYGEVCDPQDVLDDGADVSTAMCVVADDQDACRGMIDE